MVAEKIVYISVGAEEGLDEVRNPNERGFVLKDEQNPEWGNPVALA